MYRFDPDGGPPIARLNADLRAALAERGAALDGTGLAVVHDRRNGYRLVLNDGVPVLLDAIACPCCGKPVERPPSADMLGLALDLTPGKGGILRAVMAGRGQPVVTDMILRAMYRDDDDPRDPACVYSTFKEKLCLMRTKLARVGLAIENPARHRGYRVVRAAPDPVAIDEQAV